MQHDEKVNTETDATAHISTEGNSPSQQQTAQAELDGILPVVGADVCHSFITQFLAKGTETAKLAEKGPSIYSYYCVGKAKEFRKQKLIHNSL
jgi:hypothetical protein